LLSAILFCNCYMWYQITSMILFKINTKTSFFSFLFLFPLSLFSLLIATRPFHFPVINDFSPHHETHPKHHEIIHFSLAWDCRPPSLHRELTNSQPKQPLLIIITVHILYLKIYLTFLLYQFDVIMLMCVNSISYNVMVLN